MPKHTIQSIDDIIDAENLTSEFFSTKYSDIIGVTDIDEDYHNEIYGKSRATGKWELAAEDKNTYTNLYEVWRDLPINVEHIVLEHGYHTRTLPNVYKDFIVQTDFVHLSQAHESIRNDKALMLEAIKHNPANAQFTGFKLRLDQDFVAQAMAAGAQAYEPELSRYPDHSNFVVETTIYDEENDYCMELYGQNQSGIYELVDKSDAGFAQLTPLRQVFNEYIDDDHPFKEIAGKVVTVDRTLSDFMVQRDYIYISQMDSELSQDKGFMLKAIDFNTDIFYEAHELLRDDEDVVLEAIKNEAIRNESDPMMYASDRLKDDEDFLIDRAFPTDPHISTDCLSMRLQLEIGNENPYKYLKAKRLYEKLAPEIERQYGSAKDDEPEDKPRLKI